MCRATPEGGRRCPGCEASARRERYAGSKAQAGRIARGQRARAAKAAAAALARAEAADGVAAARMLAERPAQVTAPAGDATEPESATGEALWDLPADWRKPSTAPRPGDRITWEHSHPDGQHETRTGRLIDKAPGAGQWVTVPDERWDGEAWGVAVQIRNGEATCNGRSDAYARYSQAAWQKELVATGTAKGGLDMAGRGAREQRPPVDRSPVGAEPTEPAGPSPSLAARREALHGSATRPDDSDELAARNGDQRRSRAASQLATLDQQIADGDPAQPQVLVDQTRPGDRVHYPALGPRPVTIEKVLPSGRRTIVGSPGVELYSDEVVGLTARGPARPDEAKVPAGLEIGTDLGRQRGNAAWNIRHSASGRVAIAGYPSRAAAIKASAGLSGPDWTRSMDEVVADGESLEKVRAIRDAGRAKPA